MVSFPDVPTSESLPDVPVMTPLGVGVGVGEGVGEGVAVPKTLMSVAATLDPEASVAMSCAAPEPEPSAS